MRFYFSIQGEKIIIFTDNIPQIWRELQNRVSELLFQAGYHTITPHTLELVRGKVEVDVYVESPDELVKLIICECKLWNSRVTQEKIHAFRDKSKNTKNV